MQKSKYNIFSKIHNSDSYYIVNSLSGNADILDKEEAERYQNNKLEDVSVWIEKGYLVNPDEEQKIYKQKYLNFIDDRDSDEIQIFFVATYGCNFACSYCYQESYTNAAQKLTTKIIDSFFNYVTTEFAGRQKYVTLFGGEPLLPGDEYKKQLQYFINKCIENDLELAIVTNGYFLEEYIPLFEKVKIREIQVTLDGVGDIHNNRRPLKGGRKTFDKIVKGIDAALKNEITINLRAVVDKENLKDLPNLSRFAIERGWTSSARFKTQLGRNYELHTCQVNNKKLYGRVELYLDLYEMIKENPEIIKFHKPAFSISKFLFENGEVPPPLFDSCPGCKTEWAFDYTGTIYSCTATVGKKDEVLGTYYPQITKNNDIIAEWEERDVLSIKECKNCSLQLVCGGGCASIAKNKSGELHSPDCRPVKELLEMGIDLYSNLN